MARGIFQTIKKHIYTLLIAGSAAFVGTMSHAANYNWTNGASNLSWNATDTNWSAGGGNIAWADNNAAIFGATGAGAVTMYGTQTVTGLTVNATGYSLRACLKIADRRLAAGKRHSAALRLPHVSQRIRSVAAPCRPPFSLAIHSSSFFRQALSGGQINPGSATTGFAINNDISISSVIGGSANTGIFKLVDWSGTTLFSASDFSFTSLGEGLAGSFAINGSQLDFTAFSVIPEASTGIGMAALALTGGAMIARRRRTNSLIGAHR